MEAHYFKFKVLAADPQWGWSVVERESSPQAASFESPGWSPVERTALQAGSSLWAEDGVAEAAIRAGEKARRKCREGGVPCHQGNLQRLSGDRRT